MRNSSLRTMMKLQERRKGVEDGGEAETADRLKTKSEDPTKARAKTKKLQRNSPTMASMCASNQMKLFM